MTFLKRRTILSIILFTLLTFGIYRFYLFFATSSEIINQAKHEGVKTRMVSPFLAFFLIFITFGLYLMFYAYFTAKTLENIGNKYDIEVNNPTVVLILTIFIGIGEYFNYNSINIIERNIRKTQ